MARQIYPTTNKPPTRRKNAGTPSTKLTGTGAKSTRPRKWKWISQYKLTPQQWIFLNEYVKDIDPVRAYLAIPGVKATPQSAAVTASNWLNEDKHPDIALALEEILERRVARCQIDADKVLIELMHVAQVSIKDLYSEQGDLLPIHQLPDHIASAVESVQEEIIWGTIEDRNEDGEETRAPIGKLKRIKLHNKIRGITELIKHIPELQQTKRVELSGPGGAPIPVASTEMTEDEAMRLYTAALKGEEE